MGCVGFCVEEADWDNVDLRRKFAQIHKEHSPKERSFYCHFTTVTVRFSLFLFPSVFQLLILRCRTRSRHSISSLIVRLSL